MRRQPWWILTPLFLLAGCATHYYREEANNLQVYLEDGQAREVQFASSLDGFTLRRPEKTDAKTWRITLPKVGEFRYFYVIDGKVRLPDCPYREMDDFGSLNCLYTTEP
ncbi:MAG: hypothetical protein M0009_00570 [Deltaproteobacteria bacterium]|nr:hypothetical protein [Deltaproteobacteria bacterium]